MNFDFTTDESKKAAEAEAAAVGVTGTFKKHAPNTGFALIYDTKTQTVVGKLNSSKDVLAWTKALETNLGA